MFSGNVHVPQKVPLILPRNSTDYDLSPLLFRISNNRPEWALLQKGVKETLIEQTAFSSLFYIMQMAVLHPFGSPPERKKCPFSQLQFILLPLFYVRSSSLPKKGLVLFR